MAYDRRLSELQDLLKSVIPNPKDPGLRMLSDCLTRYGAITRVALSTGGRAKSKFLSVSSGSGTWTRSDAQSARTPCA